MTRDPLEEITVTIAGQSWRGFTSVSIDYSVNMAARKATLSGSDLAGAAKIMPGDGATITASGTLVLTGYVGDVNKQHDANTHTISFEIASRTIDAMEASIDHKTGQVMNKDIAGIAREFDTCGVGIACDESFAPERTSIVALGNDLVSHLRPIARRAGAFVYDTEQGQLRIAKKPRGTHSGSIAIGDGGNILNIGVKTSEKGRHDEVKVRGQASRGTGDAALRLEAVAKDSAIKRRRPRIVVLEGEATAAQVKERAERYVKRAAGYSREATVTVKGWRDAGGTIWQPHYLVHVNDPRADLTQMMAIKTVTLAQETQAGGSGTTATLSLVDPAALNGEAGNGPESFKTPDGKAKVST